LSAEPLPEPLIPVISTISGGCRVRPSAATFASVRRFAFTGLRGITAMVAELQD
jgi:hypothetical protein